MPEFDGTGVKSPELDAEGGSEWGMDIKNQQPRHERGHAFRSSRDQKTVSRCLTAVRT